MLAITVFKNFSISSPTDFELFSLIDNKNVELNRKSNDYKYLDGHITKYYYLISSQQNYNTRYFRVKGLDCKTYTSTQGLVDIVKDNKIRWIKVFTLSETFAMDLDLSNHEIAELEILYADHNK